MTTQRPASSRKPVILGIVIVGLLLVAGGGLWYLFLRPSGPAPVSLGTPAPVASGGGAAGGSTAAPAASDDPAAGEAGGGATAGDGLDGTWSTDPTVGSFSDFTGTFVGYRVKETLASIGATEAVGRTPDVTGSITIAGTTITEASFGADLTTLQSDNDRRDGQLRRQALETEAFPTATFTLAAPIDLDTVPGDGAAISVTAAGDLTLHGVTKRVDMPLQGRLDGGVITITGSLPIQFGDFGIQKPESMMVLSVEDHGVMEIQLKLVKGNA